MQRRLMRRALALARRGLGRTAPNPAVGCVIAQGSDVVGEGFHARAGEPHAELVALRQAGDAARGAELYVTLEPCTHHGRTPPCTEAIVAAGTRRVVYATEDADPRTASRSGGVLRAAGVEVEAGLLGAEARELNEGYFRHKATGRPFGLLKMAASLDGKTATRAGQSQWITGESARRQVQRLRNWCEAVVVGVGTVLHDDPSLTCRLRGGRHPLRVIADSAARTPPGAKVVAAGPPGCLIATTAQAPAGRRRRLEAAGAEVLVLPAERGRVSLAALWEELGRRNVMTALIEGGGTLAAGAVAAGVVQKLALFVAPLLIGGCEAPSVMDGEGCALLAEALPCRLHRTRRLGRDLLIEAYLCSPD